MYEKSERFFGTRRLVAFTWDAAVCAKFDGWLQMLMILQAD